jgi:hypothetical protein
MDVIGNLGDPQKDAAALEPLLTQFETNLGKDITQNIIPALLGGLTAILDGRKVTITLSVELKDQEPVKS